MAEQMALTRPARGGLTTNPNRAVRQQIPAFLNKLYTMVSDPTTNDLIRWSNEGDSFFVPNHERFGKELLPRFFKHGNFSSFVRQLNMYGFHKVPHLQQGVLQNETENELWQFVSPHFQRDQPDLLMLIQRKKANTMTGTAPAALPAPIQDDKDGPSSGSGAQTPTNSRAVDISAIASSLAAIKRHQTAISDELKDLQQSNSQLWREAMEARERHKKHQDTINRILKFLAGVFGNNASGASNSAIVRDHAEERLPRSSDDSASSERNSVALVPRKRPRLMIEDSNSGSDVTPASMSKTEGRRPMSSAQLEEADDALWADEHLLVPMDADDEFSIDADTPSTPIPHLGHRRAVSQPRIESVATSPAASASVPPTPIPLTSNQTRSLTGNIAAPADTHTSYPFAAATTNPPYSNLATDPSLSTAMIPNPNINGSGNDISSDQALQAILNGSPGSLQRLMSSMSQPGGLPVFSGPQPDMSMGQFGTGYPGTTASPMDFIQGAGGSQYQPSLQQQGVGGQLIQAPNPFPYLPQQSSQSTLGNLGPGFQMPGTNPNLSPDDLMALFSNHGGLNSGGSYIDDGHPPQDIAQSLHSFGDSLSRTQEHETAISAEMDALQQNFHTLIEQMGFDPANFDVLADGAAGLPGDGTTVPGLQPPVDFEGMLNNVPDTAPGSDMPREAKPEVDVPESTVAHTNVPEQAAAYVDEVKTASTASSPRVVDASEPDALTSPRSTRSSKRKSDVADMDHHPAATTSSKARKSTRKK